MKSLNLVSKIFRSSKLHVGPWLSVARQSARVAFVKYLIAAFMCLFNGGPALCLAFVLLFSLFLAECLVWFRSAGGKAFVLYYDFTLFFFRFLLFVELKIRDFFYSRDLLFNWKEIKPQIKPIFILNFQAIWNLY